jgi:hypothetical protein
MQVNAQGKMNVGAARGQVLTERPPPKKSRKITEKHL